MSVSQEYIKECFYYIPETGDFIWIDRPESHFNNSQKLSRELICRQWNSLHSGNKCGTKDSRGYLIITICNKPYKAHRLAFLYMEGYLPENFVDHIDRNPSNNRWSNLREVSNQCNKQNQKVMENNKTGVTGVSFDSKMKIYRASIRTKGKLKNLGNYRRLVDAVQARYEEELSNSDWECSVESSSYLFLSQYNEMKKKMPKIDFDELDRFEKEDTTIGAQEFACSGGSCELI